jgi:hypothetical protein
MAPLEPVLDIDHLRSFDVEPAYFGLGFIQLKIKRNGRVHFYHKDRPVLVDEPHDHRYGFISYIMQGRFTQEIYRWDADPEGDYDMFWEDCNPEHKIMAPAPQRGRVTEMMHGEYRARDYYKISADTLHTVKAYDNCVTYLVREEPFKTFAGVARKIGAEKVCPFSQPIPAKQCWEMIESMLPKKPIDPVTYEDLPHIKKKMGYHAVKIPKGKIGEPSKIIEEAFEIQDAHVQGIKVMTHVEMSDLYGALDRFREKYHPELSMDDLAARYRVTRRAFDNGKR